MGRRLDRSVDLLEVELEIAPPVEPSRARPGARWSRAVDPAGQDAAPAGPRLAVEALDARYRRRVVVRDVHLHVTAGEVVALVGHNGCGKSSTLHAIFGLTAHDRGEVRVDGCIVPPGPNAAADYGIGLVPAVRPVFEDLTVAENLSLAVRHLTPAARAERLDDVLTAVPELKARLPRRAGKLSGGEQRLAGIALALMRRPQVLLVDEPTAGLAPATRTRVLGALRRLAVEQRTAVLLADVNVGSILPVADRVYVMATGSVRAEHQAEDLLRAGPRSWFRLL